MNHYVRLKTADLYRPNARFIPERQRYQVLTPFGKLGYSPNVLPVLGIVLLVLPAYFIARWIRIVNEVSGHDDRVAEFGSILPCVLQGPLASTLFALACATTAAVVGAAGLTRLTGLRRQLSVATLGVGGLLSLWFVWTLL